ncbi:MAG: ATPase, T2SS/T4P/T4SS family [Desulfobacterota bacterium]|nr:ATPase, T2SS/T4P/T4SS family [Thermodesulfobacteriota bacterium]MDW8002822.1 ATPase, T2SS/T4P/T4SS family [Deltaproteobacteria bacterium]
MKEEKIFTQPNPYVGEILVKKGLISEETLSRALEIQKRNPSLKLGQILVQMGAISEDTLYRELSEAFNLPLVKLDPESLDKNLTSLFSHTTMRNFEFVPIKMEGNTVNVGVANPLYLFEVIKLVRQTVGTQVTVSLVKDEDLRKILGDYTEVAEDRTDVFDLEMTTHDEALEVEEAQAEEINDERDQPFIIRLANHIILDALKKEASDIHIEPHERGVSVRYRIDGVLHPYRVIPLRFKAGLIQRIKIMSDMDITEKRIPQDGRIRIRAKTPKGAKSVDVRVSTVPTIHGEKIVMRILDRERLFLNLSELGFEEESLKRFEEGIRKPYGMILVTGPTGSGKTNTLYSAIQKLNSPSVNIMTIEDPVEFIIPGINQVQVNDSQGLTFSAALRSFLRQDPNIILVGEIRDTETLEIAVRASLTGHLVFSTLHTNDAPSTIARLVDMGVDRYLIGASLLLIVAQRLVRKICPFCKDKDPVDKRILLSLGLTKEEIEKIEPMRGRGCEKCSYTGYKGRTGLFEVLTITPSIRELIFRGATTDEIRQRAIEEGMITLRRSGLYKIMGGITTIEEVLKETA